MSSTTAITVDQPSSRPPLLTRSGWICLLLIAALFILLFRPYLLRAFLFAAGSDSLLDMGNWAGAVGDFFSGRFSQAFGRFHLSLNGDWSHALAIPFISIYFIYQNRQRLADSLEQEGWKALDWAVRLLGLPLLIAGLAMPMLPMERLGRVGLLLQGAGTLLALMGLTLTILGPDLHRWFWKPAIARLTGWQVSSTAWMRGLGLLVAAGGLASYGWWLGPGRNDMLQGYSMVLTLLGLVLFILGPSPMQVLWFPIVYLALGVKVAPRWWEALAFQLQIIAARSATVVLKLIGVDANVEGSTIWLTFTRNGQLVSEQLNVAEACSGLRMLMAFIALGVATAYLAQRPSWHRLIMVLMSVPIAIFVNVCRVAVLGILYQINPQMAQGEFHVFVGMLMLVPAFGLFILLGWILDNIIVYDQTSSAPRSEEATAPGAAVSAGGKGWSGVLSIAGLSALASLATAMLLGLGLALLKPTVFLVDQARTAGGDLVVNELAWLGAFLSQRLYVVAALAGGVILLAICLWGLVKTCRLMFSRSPSATMLTSASALGMLLAAALGLNTSVTMMRVVLIKESLPLRRPLPTLTDQAGYWMMVREHPPLPKEQVEALGTTHYIVRDYQDTKSPPGTAGSLVTLQIAYYTGTPDTVPHVPERCFVAGGLSSIGAGLTRLQLQGEQYQPGNRNDWIVYRSGEPSPVRVPSLEIPATVFTFAPPKSPALQSNVIYFFVANGKFLASPDQVRSQGFRLTDRYSYYCKVEVLWVGVNDPKVAAQRASSFLSQMMPEIMACLPDWIQASEGIGSKKAESSATGESLGQPYARSLGASRDGAGSGM